MQIFLTKLFKSFLVSGSKCNLCIQLHFVDNELKLVRIIIFKKIVQLDTIN